MDQPDTLFTLCLENITTYFKYIYKIRFELFLLQTKLKRLRKSKRKQRFTKHHDGFNLIGHTLSVIPFDYRTTLVLDPLINVPDIPNITEKLQYFLNERYNTYHQNLSHSEDYENLESLYLLCHFNKYLRQVNELKITDFSKLDLNSRDKIFTIITILNGVEKALVANWAYYLPDHTINDSILKYLDSPKISQECLEYFLRLIIFLPKLFQKDILKYGTHLLKNRKNYIINVDILKYSTKLTELVFHNQKLSVELLEQILKTPEIYEKLRCLDLFKTTNKYDVFHSSTYDISSKFIPTIPPKSLAYKFDCKRNLPHVFKLLQKDSNLNIVNLGSLSSLSINRSFELLNKKRYKNHDCLKPMKYIDESSDASNVDDAQLVRDTSSLKGVKALIITELVFWVPDNILTDFDNLYTTSEEDEFSEEEVEKYTSEYGADDNLSNPVCTTNDIHHNNANNSILKKADGFGLKDGDDMNSENDYAESSKTFSANNDNNNNKNFWGFKHHNNNRGNPLKKKKASFESDESRNHQNHPKDGDGRNSWKSGVHKGGATNSEDYEIDMSPTPLSNSSLSCKKTCTIKQLRHLIGNCSNTLRYLEIMNCDYLTPHDYTILFRGFQNLTHLILYNAFSEDVLYTISHLKKLEFLDVSQSYEIDYANPQYMLDFILQSFPNLVGLDLSGTNLPGHIVIENMTENGIIKRHSYLSGFKYYNDRLLFLGLLNAAHNACQCPNIPAAIVTGDGNEEQILNSLEVYINRPEILQKSSTDLFMLFRYSIIRDMDRALKNVLNLMAHYKTEKNVLIAASACLFYFLKTSRRHLLNPANVRTIVCHILESMETFPDEQNMVRNGLLTLFQFNIPDEILFALDRTIAVLLKILMIRLKQNSNSQAKNVRKLPNRHISATASGAVDFNQALRYNEIDEDDEYDDDMIDEEILFDDDFVDHDYTNHGAGESLTHHDPHQGARSIFEHFVDSIHRNTVPIDNNSQRPVLQHDESSSDMAMNAGVPFVPPPLSPNVPMPVYVSNLDGHVENDNFTVTNVRDPPEYENVNLTRSNVTSLQGRNNQVVVEGDFNNDNYSEYEEFPLLGNVEATDPSPSADDAVEEMMIIEDAPATTTVPPIPRHIQQEMSSTEDEDEERITVTYLNDEEEELRRFREDSSSVVATTLHLNNDAPAVPPGQDLLFSPSIVLSRNNDANNNNNNPANLLPLPTTPYDIDEISTGIPPGGINWPEQNYLPPINATTVEFDNENLLAAEQLEEEDDNDDTVESNNIIAAETASNNMGRFRRGRTLIRRNTRSRVPTPTPPLFLQQLNARQLLQPDYEGRALVGPPADGIGANGELDTNLLLSPPPPTNTIDQVDGLAQDQTLLNNDNPIPPEQDREFDYNNVTERLDRLITRLSVCILNSLVCAIDSTRKRFAGKELGVVKCMVAIIRDRLHHKKACDEILEIAWSTLWNITDETPENCKYFLKLGGLSLFTKCIKRFKDRQELYRNMLGLLGNIAEVKELRCWLLKDEYVQIFYELLYSFVDGIEIAYNSAGILSNLLSEGSAAWNIQLPRSKILNRLPDTIQRWNIDSKRNINYRSLKPILKLLDHFETPQVQHWAVWAITNLTRVYPEKYCLLLEKENALPLLKNILTDSRPYDKIKRLTILVFNNYLKFKKINNVSDFLLNDNSLTDTLDSILIGLTQTLTADTTSSSETSTTSAFANYNNNNNNPSSSSSTHNSIMTHNNNTPLFTQNNTFLQQQQQQPQEQQSQYLIHLENPDTIIHVHDNNVVDRAYYQPLLPSVSRNRGNNSNISNFNNIQEYLAHFSPRNNSSNNNLPTTSSSFLHDDDDNHNYNTTNNNNQLTTNIDVGSSNINGGQEQLDFQMSQQNSPSPHGYDDENNLIYE